MKKILLLLMIVSVVACGCLSSKNSDSVTATPTDVAGTYTSADGNVSFTVPANVLNAYSKPAALLDANPPAITDTVNLQAVGSSYTMSPVDAVFTSPVTLKFKYPVTLPAGISPDMIRVYNYASGVWTVTSATPPTLDSAAKTITITVNNFKNSRYRLVGDIRINKLSIASVALGTATTLNVVFNKELDPATAVIPANFPITVGGVAVVPTAAVYDAATKTVTLTIPDQSANEGAAIVVAVTTSLKDKYDQAYDPASQAGTGETGTTVDLTLDAVTGLAPALNGATGGTPVVVQANSGTKTLTWTAASYNNSSSDMTYVVEIGAAGVTDFSGILQTYEVTTTSVNVSDLEKDTAFDWYNEWNWTAANPVLKTYTWRVRAIYKKGDAAQIISADSVVSNVRYDRPNELPTVPADPKVNSAVADANTIVTPGGNVSWTASTDPEGLAVTYSIDLDTKDDFTSGSVQSITSLPAVTFTPTAAELTGLADDTTYYWRVKSVDPRGGESAWSEVSQFFLNRVNDAAVISNLVPTNGGGIPNTAVGQFTADVTNTDKDTYSYKVDVYSDAGGATSVGTHTATALPIAMTDITWTTTPGEDVTYYWKLTVTETTATLPPAGAPVVSALQTFVKSDGDTKPVVTLNAPTTAMADATNYQLGEDTAFTWTATDTDSNTATFTYDVAVFSADSDSSILFQYTTGVDVKTSTVKSIKADHGLTKDTTVYYWGVRANDNAAFATDDSRTSAYGDWVRKPFYYKEGPTISNVTIGNITDQQFTVLWRTDSDATTQNDKLYYTTDGSDPTNASTSVVDASALNKIHVTTVNLGSSSANTTVKFYVESESTVLVGLKTADKNNGSYYEVTMGKAYSGAPPAPATLLMDLTNSTNNNVFVAKLSYVKEFMGSSFTLKTYNFIGMVAQNKISLNDQMNRWESNDFDGVGATIDGSVYTSMKVIDVVYHSDTAAKTVTGEHTITDVGVTFPTATIDVQ